MEEEESLRSPELKEPLHCPELEVPLQWPGLEEEPLRWPEPEEEPLRPPELEEPLLWPVWPLGQESAPPRLMSAASGRGKYAQNDRQWRPALS